MAARRGAGAVERDGLENRCAPRGPWVRIPPPPLVAEEPCTAVRLVGMRRLTATIAATAVGAALASAGNAGATLRNPCPQSAPYLRVVAGKAYCRSDHAPGHMLLADTRSSGGVR